jgi:hypothetical protein
VETEAYVIFQHLQQLGATRVMNAARKRANHLKKLLEAKQTAALKETRTSQQQQQAENTSAPDNLTRSVSAGRGVASQASNQLSELRKRLSVGKPHTSSVTSGASGSSGSGAADGSVGVAERMKRLFDDDKDSLTSKKVWCLFLRCSFVVVVILAYA